MKQNLENFNNKINLNNIEQIINRNISYNEKKIRISYELSQDDNIVEDILIIVNAQKSKYKEMLKEQSEIMVRCESFFSRYKGKGRQDLTDRINYFRGKWSKIWNELF